MAFDYFRLPLCTAHMTTNSVDLTLDQNITIVSTRVSFLEHQDSLDLDLYFERYGPNTNMCRAGPKFSGQLYCSPHLTHLTSELIFSQNYTIVAHYVFFPEVQESHELAFGIERYAHLIKPASQLVI